jgi:hypothetical protein
VALLAATGVALFLRFHHAPFRVTGVQITRQARTGCSADLTGEIRTNGGAGTVTYEWVFRPEAKPPQPLRQTVAAGQRAVDVTAVVQGNGSLSRTVTLRVIGAEQKSASAVITLSC